MLPLINQFLLKQAIRSNLYLADPPVISQDNIFLPRFSILHYLDLNQENHFPDRTLYYFKDIAQNKKIPVTHIHDLVTKEGTTTLVNRYLETEIRKWNQTNIKVFRSIDLLETPNTDSAAISVFNYNPVKDLYKYQTSLLAAHYRYRNLAETFWSTVTKSLKASPESYSIVPIELPSIIPSKTIIDRLLKLDNVKLVRVVNDQRLLWVLDIFRWLSDRSRETTPLRDISDEDSNRVIIEFKCKGYSSFLPLSVIRTISKESPIKYNVKIPTDKVEKLFLLCLFKIQDKVTSILEQSIDEGQAVDVPDEQSLELPDTETDDQEVPASEPNVQIANATNAPITKLSDAIKKADNFELDEAGFDDLLDDHAGDSFVDSFFEERLASVAVTPTKLSPETPSVSDKQPDEEPPVIRSFTQEEKTNLLTDPSPEDLTQAFLDKAIAAKTHTSAELRAIRKLADNRTLLKNPYKPNELLDRSIEQAAKDVPFNKENIKIPINNSLVDDNLKTNIIGNFDRKYLDTLYRKDVIASVGNLEKSGLIIKDYEVENTTSSIDNYETHKLTVKPLDGKESTVYFRLPKVDSDGVMMVGGIRYKLRKQRTDLPIRKISPTRVAITSNYGKLFVSRTERKTNDPNAYIIKFIQSNYLGEGTVVKKIVPGSKHLNKLKVPNIYHLLSTYFNEVHLENLTLLLVEKDITNYITNQVAADIKQKGYQFCGYLGNKNILVVGYNNVFYDYSNGMTPVGTIEDLLGLDKEKTPKAFSTLKVLGEDIPLGVAMSFYLGISGLIAATDTTYRLMGPRQQYKPTDNELVIRFNDHKLILTTDTIEKQLLFNGFNYYRDFIKGYPLEAFDNEGVYLNLVEFRGAGLIHLKELKNLRSLFLDPITIDVLEQIHEPKDFLKLLLRANQMLEDYTHPDINDPTYSRIRGYDRIPGLMYRALAESVREYKLRGRSGGKVSLDPYKVWNYITQDSTGKACEDLNPVLNLKESEAITLTGADGLSKDATPKELRRFHPNDTGLISEATVDSSDVALNIYLVPYAKLKGVRGLVDATSENYKENASKVFSSSVQIAPMSEHDDAKRINGKCPLRT